MQHLRLGSQKSILSFGKSHLKRSGQVTDEQCAKNKFEKFNSYFQEIRY